jgi:hypothetical protein
MTGWRVLERRGVRAEEPWLCSSTSQDLMRYLAHDLSVKGEDKTPNSHALHKPERGSSDENTGIDFRTRASRLRQSKNVVPSPLLRCSLGGHSYGNSQSVEEGASDRCGYPVP